MRKLLFVVVLLCSAGISSGKEQSVALKNVTWGFSDEMAQYLAQCYVHGVTLQKCMDDYLERGLPSEADKP